MRKVELVLLFVVCMGIASFLPNSLWAAVTGPCGTCHTMHNSQDGEDLSDSPSTHLTKGGCIGCHTGTNDGTNVIPYVYSETEPTYGTDTLAGGNFWWVATAVGGNDTRGHNVLGLSNEDTNIPASVGAPGSPPAQAGCANSCHDTLAVAQTAMPLLGSGCEGCHLAVKHHKNDHPGGNYNNVVGEDGGWFRYCSGHVSGDGFGVEGIEDDDWQYTSSQSDHNEYLGFEGDHGFDAGFYNLGNTMTAYCCGCHGGFHVQSDGMWIRHPSDAVLPSTGEYAAYTVYDPVAPVARPVLTDSGPSQTVTPGTDLVMCLSCHRAHGSPYADLLRWDYADETFAGGGGTADGTGCFVCHTEKDD